MSDRLISGRVTVHLGAQTYQAEWRVDGDQVEVASHLGTERAPLGALRGAPGTVARERLMEMARRAEASQRPRPAGPRFNIRDVR